MEHGIFSEAITRFTKGQPEYQTLAVAEMCAAMLSDGFKATGVVDACERNEVRGKVKVSTQEINELLGTEYTDAEIVTTLSNVGFVVKERKGELTVTVPEWRTDIHIPEDIIEEVGRLRGYDNITPTLPRHATAGHNKMWGLKTRVRDILESFGANEVLTYSFVSERLLKKVGMDATNSYRIVNSISPELQLVRQTIVPSLLDKAYMNQKFPVDKFAMYEMNKVYQKSWGMDDEGVPVESMRLGFIIAERKNDGTAYYAAKRYVMELLGRLGIEAESIAMRDSLPEDAPYEPKRAAEIMCGGQRLGIVGEFKNSVKRNLKLADYLAGFELDMDAVLGLAQDKSKVRPYEVKNKEDITLATEKTYAEALAEVRAEHEDAVITPVGIYQAAGSEQKNITFHLEYL